MTGTTWAVLGAAAIVGLGCPAPVVPRGGVVPLAAVVGDGDGLRLVDLGGAVQARELLLGGGWTNAVWVGCTSWVVLDRRLGEERTMSALNVENGQLIAVGPGPIERWVREPAILDALVQAFGVEDAYPEDRLRHGAVRGDASGRPAVELVGAGTGERPDVVVGLEAFELPLPVERELGESAACGAGVSLRWVMRSPYGEGVLGGEAGGWACERVAGATSDHDDALEGGGVPGVSGGGAADRPLVVEVPGVGEVSLPGSAPVDGYELCRRPGGGWRAVRVEQPGPYGFDVLYVVRDGDGAVWEAARYDVTDLVAAGIGMVSDVLIFGGPEGWFVARGDEDPVRVSDFPPAIP